MWRPFSIVIFSWLTAASSVAQLEWQIASNGGVSIVKTGSAGYTLEIVIRRDGQVVSNYVAIMPSTTSVRYPYSMTEGGHYSFEVIRPLGAGLESFGGTWGGVADSWEPGDFQYPTPTPTPTPPPDEYEVCGDYYFEFGPAFAGTRVTVYASPVEETLWEFAESVMVPAEGCVLSGSYCTTRNFPHTIKFEVSVDRGEVDQGEPMNRMELLDVDGDGVYDVPTFIINNGVEMEPGVTYEQDGQTWESLGDGNWRVTYNESPGAVPDTGESTAMDFPVEYGGGRWAVRNEDGEIVAEGDIPPGGGTVIYDGPRLPGETLTWEAAPLVYDPNDPEGLPSFGAPVDFGSGRSVVVSAPSDPPAVPDPSPVSTPVPLPSPLPSPSPVSFPPDMVNGDEEVVEEVTEDFSSWEVDDGEQVILSQADGLAATFRAIINKLYDLNEVFGKITDKWTRASTVTPQEVSQQCTFAFGDAQVDLNPFGRYRFATGAFAWFLAAVVFHSLIRDSMRK